MRFAAPRARVRRTTAAELQHDLAGQLSRSRVEVAEGSWHRTQDRRPDLVAEAIREVVAAARGR